MFLERILFKAKCFSCGRFSSSFLCQGCINQFQELPLSFCSLCKSNKVENNQCEECLKRRPLFNNLVALGIYNGLLKSLIYNFKYEGFKEYGFPLGCLISDKIRQETDYKKIDYTCAIPLHKDKLKQRKFNQSEIIARAIAKKLHIPYCEIFSREKNTQPQHSLSVEQREKNLKDAFSINPGKNFKEKSILIVDDIYTTGATIHEACLLLKESGVKDIYVAVLARSLG